VPDARRNVHVNFIDLTGQRFGRLVVINRAPNANGKAQWRCVCDCGGATIVLGRSLRSGATQSCGCNRGEHRLIDLTGQRFGRLVVRAARPVMRGGRHDGCVPATVATTT
jgi:hypothetical protein